MVPMGFATINDLYLTNEHSSGVYMTLHVERKSVHVFALIDWPLIWFIGEKCAPFNIFNGYGFKEFFRETAP